MKTFPKSWSGSSWQEAAAEGRPILSDHLKGNDVDDLISLGSQAKGYMNACSQAMKDGNEGAVVVSIPTMRFFSALAAFALIEELARREAEFNRAASQ